MIQIDLGLSRSWVYPKMTSFMGKMARELLTIGYPIFRQAQNIIMLLAHPIITLTSPAISPAIWVLQHHHHHITTISPLHHLLYPLNSHSSIIQGGFSDKNFDTNHSSSTWQCHTCDSFRCAEIGGLHLRSDHQNSPGTTVDFDRHMKRSKKKEWKKWV